MTYFNGAASSEHVSSLSEELVRFIFDDISRICIHRDSSFRNAATSITNVDAESLAKIRGNRYAPTIARHFNQHFRQEFAPHTHFQPTKFAINRASARATCALDCRAAKLSWRPGARARAPTSRRLKYNLKLKLLIRLYTSFTTNHDGNVFFGIFHVE